MGLCPHCMQPANTEVCPHCGGNVNWQPKPGQLPVGTLLSGANGRTYQIGAARGQGGFGITYAALDMDSRERVAVKEYFPTRCANRTQLNQVQPQPSQTANYQSGLHSFLEEAKMLAAVGALPSVVTVRDYFEANGSAYLVMEYLDGVPLYQIVNTQGRIPADQLMPRLPALLRDLSKLHQAGVIHRDISPDNLMQMPDGTLKLLDFGSARSVEDGRSMTVLLKPGFSPVEQYRTKGQGPWTDVYALAATIYYCLTGLIPPTSVERLDNDTLQSPISLGVALTPEQEDALLWGLCVQPNSRPANVDVFAQRLFPKKPEQKPWSKPGPILKTKTEQKAPISNPSFHKKASTDTATGKQKPPLSPKSLLVKVLIGLATAIVCIIIYAISYSLVSSLTDKPAESLPPFSRPSAGQASSAPTARPSSKPSVVSGTLDNGFAYEVVDEEYAVLTGYTGTSSSLSMPDDIDGVPITQISDAAFAGSTMTTCFLPIHLETIGASAFKNCAKLTKLYAYSDVETAADSFSGCSSLRLVQMSDRYSESGWTVPQDCLIFHTGLDTGAGSANYFTVGSQGEIYATTDDDYAVLIDVPAGIDSLELLESVANCPVTWIYDKAFRHADDDIYVKLSSECAFPFELFMDISWDADENTFSANWFFSCLAAYYLNTERDSGAPEFTPQAELVRAAMTRATELETSYTEARPDGSKWSSAISEQTSDWSYARAVRGYMSLDSDEEAVLDEIMELDDHFLSPSDYGYYSRIGIAYYWGDRLYHYSITTIP